LNCVKFERSSALKRSASDDEADERRDDALDFVEETGVDFFDVAAQLIEKHDASLAKQLRRCASSVPLNLREGSGSFGGIRGEMYVVASITSSARS